MRKTTNERRGAGQTAVGKVHGAAGTVTPPATFEELRLAINLRHSQLPKRLASAARLVVDRPDQVALGSVASIAMAAEVAPSTLIRLAQLLGFDGFSAMQDIVRDAVRGRYALRLSDSPSDEGTQSGRQRRELHETIAAGHLALDTLVEGKSPEGIETAADILSVARCVFVLTGNQTLPLAAHLHNCFTGLGMHSVILEEGRNRDLFCFATLDDACVVIDRAAAPHVADAAALLAERGLPLILISDSDVSPLSSHATASFRAMEETEQGLLRITAGIALGEALALAASRIVNSRSS
ncbi:MurR/RpiR family transcriptional regulator [Rhizobium sp. CC-YZS058]|uniref:MurR/RpiR family transcriptional regulator n=1 Tax=Rhizobium sp. CC-YZS058 TaxID=3042153 RepID=UPI002B05373F|nr:MurR/RpiR family transcriptional regulator [Rhizobium sp. CC-YZS058]MEA3537053.1 MurR/RpiR family transcriptional regulator [Rhizobium sp. CC-YZS058]